MNTEIVKSLQQSFNELTGILSALDQQQWNKVPFEGSWTPGQVADHLFMSYDAIETLKGNVVQTSRPIDAKRAEIEKLFLNFDIKMKSPDFIIPHEGTIEKTELLKSLELRTKELIDFAGSNDISLTCTDFELPGDGPLTRLEWLAFINVHTKRHTHQLKKMQPYL
ncbi:MAG TPA: DinB family protein [Pedobacter sp.]|nr:DinB family protein [Pedobacter sp.]